MNWQAAIKLNRDALLRLLAALVAMTAPNRQTRNMILRVLRPAESAARRLIVIAARLYVKTPRANAPLPNNPKLPDFTKFARSTNTPAFKLFDPRKRFDLGNPKKPKRSRTFMPRISVIGISGPQFRAEKQAPQNINAQMARRIKALQNALENLPREAKRLARQMEKRKTAPAGPRRVPPLRPGLPPGHCSRSKHEVHAILRECHALAVQVLVPVDTT